MRPFAAPGAGGKCTVTTSWDDGHHLDGRLAEILTKHGVGGTFYVSKCGKRRTAGDTAIRALSPGFEIGAHGLNHVSLIDIEQSAARYEIRSSKTYIEGLIDRPCRMFAYPYGATSDNVVSEVVSAGFLGARTVANFRNAISRDPFRLPTTIQACKFFTDRTNHLPDSGDVNDLRGHLDFAAALTASKREYDWITIAKNSFDLVYSMGGVWHLWGHAWEVDEHNLWTELGEILEYAMAHANVSSAPNSDVLHTRGAK